MTVLLTAAVFSIGGIIYPYLFYPIVLWALRSVRHKSGGNVVGSKRRYRVTFVICVYNGERHIAQKLENVLGLNGFDESCEIIVVSDCSTDHTDAIVSTFLHPRVRLIRVPTRMGKANAENYVLGDVTGDIVVFTDASTQMEKYALGPLLWHFADARVGCVSTEDLIVTTDNESGRSEEGLYVRYEMLLRRFEADLGVLAGASGSAYACRRELAVEIPGNLTRDLHVPLLAKERGYVTISEPQAKCLIRTHRNVQSEFLRKIRTFTGGIDTLLYMKHMLNPFRYGFFAVALLSHKLVRWTAPFLMAVALVSTGLLGIELRWASVVFLMQVLGYGYCGLRHVLGRELGPRVLDTVYFFVLTNLAAGAAWVNHFRGKTFVTWTPTARS